MKKINAGKTFTVLSYWARLPGFAAFCGVSIGVCAAKLCLAQPPGSAPSPLIYIRLLLCATIFSAAAGILCRRACLRAVFFAVCGAALFAGTELDLRNFYLKMEDICGRSQIFTLQVRITSPVASTRYGSKFRGKVIGADDAEVELALRGKTLQFSSRAPVPPYGAVTAQGRYSAPRPAAGPLGFDQREHFAVNNIYGNFAVSRVLGDDYNAGGSSSNRFPPGSLTDKISHRARIRVHSIIGKASNENVRAIFHAAFLDEREHLSDSLRTVLRKAGIVHLLAISGFHAMLLYSAIYIGLGLFAIPSKHRTIIALALLWCYLFFIGFIPSLFRATVMATFFCVSTLLQRKNHSVHSLGLAGFFWLCVSPYSLFSPGFQLSFAATAGIIMLQPVLDGVTGAINSKIRNKPLEFLMGKTLSPIWLSLTCTAVTVPPLLYHFGMISLYGIPFNPIAIPMMSAAMWCFFAALVLSPIDALAGAAIWCADKILGLMIYLSGFSLKFAWSEVVFPNVTALQLFIMTAFMAGLCGVSKDLRGAYIIRIGGLTALVFAATVLHTAITAKTENLEFTRPNASISVIIRKNNDAWIAAQGSKNDIRQLREREIEPLLYRKKIISVPLFLINEEAEEEAHEFSFNTGLAPRIVSLRNRRADDERGRGDEGYVRLDYQSFISPDGACSLRVDSAGRVTASIKDEH